MSINQWPCIPEKLTDFMYKEIISFIIGGLSEEYDLSMSIVEPDGERYDPFDPMQNYPPFCKYGRFGKEKGRLLFPGFDENCKCWDETIAHEYLDNPGDYELHVPYLRPCWMNLQDYIVLAETGGHRYAIFTGQYIQKTDDGSGLQKVEAKVDQWTEKHHFTGHQKFIKLKNRLKKHSYITPEIETKIRDCAYRTDQFFDYYWREQRNQVEDEILRNLYNALGGVQTIGMEPDWGTLVGISENLCSQLGCSHVLIFAAETRQQNRPFKDHGNVLMLRASAGLPERNRDAPPHFNWHKAGCMPEGLSFFDPTGQDPAWQKLIRHDNVPEPPPSSVLRALGDETHGMRCVVVLGQIKGLGQVQGAKEFLNELLDRFCERIQHLLFVASLQHSEETLREERDFVVHQVNSRMTTFEDYQKAVEETYLDDINFSNLKPYHETFINARRDLADHAQFVQRGFIEFHNPGALKINPTNIVPILEAALDEKGIRADSEQIDIIRQFDQNLPPPLVDVDAFWLKTIFIHLLDNAIKYSRQPRRAGKRWIAVRATVDGKNLVVEIKNYGLGILPENIEKVFEKGIRIVDGTRFEHKPGMGRGLFEARAIAHAMKAEIKAHSRHHSGGPVTKGQIDDCITCFQVIIPITRRRS